MALFRILGVPTWPDTAQWKSRLSEEVRITKHVNVLHDEPEQRHQRIDDVKFTTLRPDWIQTVVNCKCTHSVAVPTLKQPSLLLMTNLTAAKPVVNITECFHLYPSIAIVLRVWANGRDYNSQCISCEELNGYTAD